MIMEKYKTGKPIPGKSIGYPGGKYCLAARQAVLVCNQIIASRWYS